MTFIKYALLWAVMLFAISCSKDNTITQNTDETFGLKLVTTIYNATHQINIYTASGQLQQGYNQVFLQVKNTDGSLVNNAAINWKPVMHMMSMQHACPYSAVKKSANTHSLYEGYIVFQMAGNASEYWELTIDYMIGSSTYTATDRVAVATAAKRNVVSFTGSDKVNYILALVAPANPKVAINDMQAMLFKMDNMMSFPVVNNYTIKIDPRMPGMGNHGSPNNVDLQQTETGDVYKGKLSLTMTGYWKVNLQLQNEAGAILKGEPVTTTNEGSSIFFEIEF